MLEARLSLKVTIIYELTNLSTTNLALLFDKLHEQEIERTRLVKSREGNKKSKGLALKATNVKDMN